MKKVLTCLLIINLGLIYGQNSRTIYPEGVYNSLEDFINKKPKTKNPISAKQGKNIIITTYRIKDGDGNKIKNAFAVSDGQHVYVRTNAMLQHLTNSAFDKPNAADRDYSLAHLVNNDYLYFEVFFQSKSVRTWGIGKVYLSGIIYDNSTGKFTILETTRDLEIVLGELIYNEIRGESLRVNGQNIDIARKEISRLFKSE